jgi:MFS family permease
MRATTVDAERQSHRGWYTVFMLSIVVMLAHIDRGVIALLVQPLKRDLGFSDTEVSILVGFAFTFPYVVIGLPMSRVVDRGVRKHLIAGSLAVWSVATAVCGLAHNFWALFFSRAVIGGAESINTPATISMIADAVPRHRLARAYSIYHAGFTAGAALSLVIGGLLIGLLADVPPISLPGIGIIRNWQLVFMIVGIPGLIVAAVLVITVPEPARRGGKRPGGYPLREVFNSVLSQRTLHLSLLPAMVLLAIMTNAVLAWQPAFYERTYGWGPEMAGPMLGVVALGASALGLLVGAPLCELLGKRHDDANLRVLFIAQLLALPLVAAGPLMPNPWLALACGGIGTFCSVMGGPAFVSALQLATPNEMRGQINVMYATLVNVVGGSLGPTLTGLLSDYVAPSEADLRYVLVGIKLVVGPPALFLLWKAIKPYGVIHRQRIDSGE